MKLKNVTDEIIQKSLANQPYIQAYRINCDNQKVQAELMNYIKSENFNNIKKYHYDIFNDDYYLLYKGSSHMFSLFYLQRIFNDQPITIRMSNNLTENPDGTLSFTKPVINDFLDELTITQKKSVTNTLNKLLNRIDTKLKKKILTTKQHRYQYPNVIRDQTNLIEHAENKLVIVETINQFMQEIVHYQINEELYNYDELNQKTTNLCQKDRNLTKDDIKFLKSFDH